MDLGEIKRWTPEAQQRALEKLEETKSQNNWRPFYCKIADLCGGQSHGEWTWNHARPDQHPPNPALDWLTWLVRGGRGSGKTRTGAEWTHRVTKYSSRIALLGATLPDVRETMIEGESGILATARPGAYPQYEPSKRRLTWPNGARAQIFTAEEPDRLRGPQHRAAWADEPAHYPNIEEVWSNLLFGLRLKGSTPVRICATTTPKPIDWIKELIKDPTTVSVVASTYKNLENLDPVFRQQILSRYENTRLGRQEIDGELLGDVEGALWSYDIIEPHMIDADDVPHLDRIVVAVDPAGTSRKKSNKTGILVVGVAGTDYYVLADYSGKYSPAEWGATVVRAYQRWSADQVVAEINYGGEMVEEIVDRAAADAGEIIRYKPVTSRRGKSIRADPVVALTERGKVHIVRGLQDLIDQLVSWVPPEESPDRLDAMVHGVTELAHLVEPSAIAVPSQVRISSPGVASVTALTPYLQGRRAG